MDRRSLLKFVGLAPVSLFSLSHQVNLSRSVKFKPATDTYFISDHNTLAWRAGQNFVLSNSEPKLMFLQGEFGSGKTRLLKELKSVFETHNNSKKTILMNSEVFSQQCIQAIRRNEMDKFRANLFAADLLLIDESEYLSRGAAVQEELFHMIRKFTENSKKIILTSDVKIKDIKFAKALSSIIEGGIQFELNSTIHQERYHFAKFQSEALGIQISEEELKMISEPSAISFRSIEGKIYCLDAFEKSAIENKVSERRKFVISIKRET